MLTTFSGTVGGQVRQVLLYMKLNNIDNVHTLHCGAFSLPFSSMELQQYISFLLLA
jgi:hypothetical protein